MFAVTINALSIIAGTLVGIIFKRFISEAMARHLQIAIGCCVIVVSLKMALQFEHFLTIIACVALGGIIGFWLGVEKKTQQLGRALEKLFPNNQRQGFAIGFSTSSILFCAGAMAVIGSINAGVRGDNEILLAKSLMDGITSATMAAIYGIGVGFSAIPVFLYQGLIAMAAMAFGKLLPASVLHDVSGVGGVLVMMIGFNLAGLSKLAIGDFLPAILLVLLSGLWA